ncbi:unnamed protein product [Microthlaspi erraticum]|uniref:Aspartic peptidase DDI1-type domain-containing protein n=1 Tax=Microthlaspi erraticum TaxID=1685480 RepID=A0A6D2JQL0_9BRAS|nr:unnamed protein product [Microthlaspi erraticum]
MSEAFDQMQMVKDVMANSDKVSEVLKESTHQFNLLTSPLSYQREARHCWSLQRPTTSIMFGDATSKSPLGVFKNYHLKIGECIIQTDLTVMEMEEEKDLPLLLGTPFLSTVGASIDFHKQEVILHKVNSLVSYRLQPRGSDFCATIEALSVLRAHEATKVVKERLTKNQELEKDKDERGPRIEKPRLERARVEKPRSDRPRADRLVQAPCVLDEESLQALFDEPLGRALKEGEDAASKALVG